MVWGQKAGIAAVLGLAAAAVVPSYQAHAADLGGNCCADLEERIAELEATTARKGNRKVSLEVSGFVNEAVFLWDDGGTSDAYITTNEINPTRVRFKGDAKIGNGATAGYLLELGTNSARQDRESQVDPDGSASVSSFIIVRHSAWFLGHKDYGKLWVGLTSDAADGITEINTANTGHFASANVSQSFGDGGGGFFIRRKDGVLSGINFGDLVLNGWGGTPDGHRQKEVKYETPTFLGGFVGAVSAGEDNIYNVGLRYNGEYQGFRLAAGIAYSKYEDPTSSRRRGFGEPGNLSDVDVDEWGGSASILHTETGLFVTGAYGQDTDNNLDSAANSIRAGLADITDDTAHFYFLQGGIERSFFSVGKTTIFGEYFKLDRGLGLNSNGTALQTGVGTLGAGAGVISNSELEGFGFGVNQNLSGAIDLYVNYRHVSPDVTVANTATLAETKAQIEDFDYVTAGAYIKF